MTSGYKICEIWHIVVCVAFWYTVRIDWIYHAQARSYGYKRTTYTDQHYFKKSALSRTPLDMVADTQTI